MYIGSSLNTGGSLSKEGGVCGGLITGACGNEAIPCSFSVAKVFLKSATSASYWSVALFVASLASFLKSIASITSGGMYSNDGGAKRSSASNIFEKGLSTIPLPRLLKLIATRILLLYLLMGLLHLV